MNSTEKLIRLIGTPFNEEIPEHCGYTDLELIDIYDEAFKNRVALLYLEMYRHPDWNQQLEEKFQLLKQREEMTYSVIAKIAETLNLEYKNKYVVFKSIKPYPATPNDTDILFLGNKDEYKRANDHLLRSGYIFHEWAPQKKTYYDPRGIGKIGKGKKGGTYYIDFYEEISTDYYAYCNKKNISHYVTRDKIKNIEVNLLAPEPELAIIMFHNVFPERTFQLEHFYLPLYYFKNKMFDLNKFISFVKKNNLDFAIRANISLIKELHMKYFSYTPDIIVKLLQEFGEDKNEVSLFKEKEYNTPYMFSPKVFFKTFLLKTVEWYSFKSLLVQGMKMFNPIFFIDVIRSLKKRLSEKGVYHLE